MSLLQQDKFTLDVSLGRILRIPCKFVHGESKASPLAIEKIAQQLQVTGKNILPVIVKLLGEDNYQATFNTQILEAARQAKMDFVWCIVVDDLMQEQVDAEALQPEPKPLRLNVLTASDRDIIKVLEQVKQTPGCNRIKPEEAAKAIVERRNAKKLTSLDFLTKQRCGIGDATVRRLNEFLVVA